MVLHLCFAPLRVRPDIRTTSHVLNCITQPAAQAASTPCPSQLQHSHTLPKVKFPSPHLHPSQKKPKKQKPNKPLTTSTPPSNTKFISPSHPFSVPVISRPPENFTIMGLSEYFWRSRMGSLRGRFWSVVVFVFEEPPREGALVRAPRVDIVSVRG